MLIEKDPHSSEIKGTYSKRDVEKPTEILVIGAFPELSKNSIEFQLFEELTNEFRETYRCRHTFDSEFVYKTFKVCWGAAINLDTFL